jgi:hypothetical protein
MPLHIPPEAKDAAPGLIGALIAIPWTQGPLLMRASVFLGGIALSWFGTAPVSSVLGMADSAKGLAGFVLGLFGMSVAAKVYEAITSFDSSAIGKAVIDFIRKRLGV